MRDCPEPPLVVLVTDMVEVTVGGRVVVAMVDVAVDTMVVEDATDPAGPKDPVSEVDPRPPETATRARARRTPATSPIPKRFPSISLHPPWEGR